MPTYDYRCPNGHDFEHFYRNISEATAEFACPKCGAVGQRRISGGAGLVFKGSGFYLTDYGKNAHRAPASSNSSKGEGSGEGKGDAGADGKKADAKSDATSETKREGPKGDSGASASSSDASGGKSPAKSEPRQSSEQKSSPGKNKGGDAQ